MVKKHILSQKEDAILIEQQTPEQKAEWLAPTERQNEVVNKDEDIVKSNEESPFCHDMDSIPGGLISEWDVNSTKSLFNLYEKYGPKWTQIAKEIGNKNENLAKNRFYCALRKYLRVVNQFLKEKAKKSKNQKELKYESVIRVLEVRDSLPPELKLHNFELRKRIIDEALLMAIEDNYLLESSTQDFIASINKFNLGTRNFKIVKSKIPKQPNQEKVVALQNQEVCISDENQGGMREAFQQTDDSSRISSNSQESVSKEENFNLDNLEVEKNQINEQKREKNFMEILLDELDTPFHYNLFF